MLKRHIQQEDTSVEMSSSADENLQRGSLYVFCIVQPILHRVAQRNYEPVQLVSFRKSKVSVPLMSAHS